MESTGGKFLESRGSMGTLIFYPLVAFVVLWESLVQGRPYFHDDLLIQNFIFRDFLRSQLLSGHFPLWDPYLFAGKPFFADPNSMAAYPLFYPTLLFPTAYGMSVFNFIHLVLAFWGARFLLRSFGIGEEACRIGAITYGLSGFFVWEIIHPPILAAFAWFPWVLGSLERALLLKRSGPAFAAGAAFAMAALAGSFQMTLMIFYAGVLYVLLRWSAMGGPKVSWRQAGALVWGAVPAPLWLVPAAGVIASSRRTAGPLDYYRFNAVFSLDPKHWAQFLWPVDPMGPTFLPQTDYVDNMGNLGLMAPLLVLLGLRIFQRGWTIFFLLGLLGVLIGFGPSLPFHHWAVRWLPGFSYLRAPARAIFLFTLAGAFFSARGFEALLEKISAGKAPFIRARQSTLLLFVVLVWLWAAFIHSVRPGPAANFDYASRFPFLSQVKASPERGRALVDDHIPYPVSSGTRSYLARFPVNSASLLGVPTINGYSPLVSYAFERSKTLPAETFFKLWAVDRYLVRKDGPAPPGKLLAEDDRARLLESGEPRPMAWAVESSSGTQGGDDADLWTRMKDPGFDPYREAFIGGAYDMIYRYPKTRSKVLSSWDGPDRARFQLETDKDARMVFSIPYAKEWKASLDGKPVKVEMADGLLPSVSVPKGAHEVRFDYRPDWVLPLGALAFLWLLSLGAVKRILPLG